MAHPGQERAACRAMIVHVAFSAVRDYQQQVAPRLSADEALAAIVADLRLAHLVRGATLQGERRELWRGPSPKRVRYIIERHRDRCDVVAVQPAHGGLRRPTRRVPGDEHIQQAIEMPDPAIAPQRPARTPPASAPAVSTTRPTASGRKPLGQLLRELREARGMTTTELATRAGLEEDVVLDLEDGHGMEADAELDAILDALGADLVLVPRRP